MADRFMGTDLANKLYDCGEIQSNELPQDKIPANSLQEKFYRELQDAVSKHCQYLQEVAWMHIGKPSGSYLLIKRIMDLFVGIVGLILLFPIFPIVAIIIKMDSRGPIIFCQERVGKGRKLFRIYKFRTMYVDAESKTGPIWCQENDPRITFAGKFLRRSKIDEFPQFLNLVKGDMTLVGPRPERPYFVNQFVQEIPGYIRRLDVTPGITGAAQLRNGPDSDPIDVIRKLRYDITYIKRMSLSMDIRLLIETFLAVFSGRF